MLTDSKQPQRSIVPHATQFRIRTLMAATGIAALTIVGYKLWTGPSLNKRLEIAGAQGNATLFSWLVWLGADANDGLGQNGYSLSPLQNAVLRGDMNAVRLFVEHGANVDYSEKDGFRAIHYAADREQWEMVHYLFSAGANYRAPDATGNTAISYAEAVGHLETIRLLHNQPTPVSRWQVVFYDRNYEDPDDPQAPASPYIRRDYSFKHTFAGTGEVTVARVLRSYLNVDDNSVVVKGVEEYHFSSDGNWIEVLNSDGSRDTIPL